MKAHQHVEGSIERSKKDSGPLVRHQLPGDEHEASILAADLLHRFVGDGAVGPCFSGNDSSSNVLVGSFDGPPLGSRDASENLSRKEVSTKGEGERASYDVRRG